MEPERPKDNDDEFDPALEIKEAPVREHLAKWWIVYLLMLGIAGLLLYRDFHRAGDFNGSLGVPRSVNSPAASPNMWVLPDKNVPAGDVIRGLVIHLGNRYRQDVSFSRETSHATIMLESKTRRDPLVVSSHDFKAIPGTMCRVSGELGNESGTQGTVVIRVLAGSATDPTVLATIPTGIPDSFTQAFTIPAGAEVFRVEIDCQFQGWLYLSDLNLERVEPASSGTSAPE